MSVTPTGQLSLALHYLRQSVAASSAFQALVGADSAAEALGSVYMVDAVGADRPLALVTWADEWERVVDSTGTRNVFRGLGDLLLMLMTTPDSEQSDSDAAVTFTNALGGLMDDLEAVAGTHGYLDIERISLQEGMARATNEEAEAGIDDYYAAVLRIRFVGGSA